MIKNKSIGIIVILLGLVIVCAPAQADHLQSKVNTDLDDGGLITSKSFKSNYWVYRSIGGSTHVKSKKKKRSWKCAWLCKKRKKKKAESIQIENFYYAKVANVFLEPVRKEKTCTNASSCTLKEWAIGVTPSLKFPSDLGEVKIVGVITNHRITVDGESFSKQTTKGQHPVIESPLVE